MPVLPELFEQLGTEHHVPVFAPLAALDVNDHPLLVDVAELQVRELGIAGSGGVEGHQHRAMEGSGGRLDELRNFFLAEDRWQARGPFRIGGFGDAPALLERFAVEEPQGRQTDRHGAR